MSVEVQIVVGVALFYSLALLGTMPFLVYFGKPKRWQKVAELLMSFPFDNEKFGFFSINSVVVFLLINGLSFGLFVLGFIKVVLEVYGL